MNRILDVTLTILFVGIMFAVGIVQAVSELTKKETVQFLDPFEDTFVTPFKNMKATAKRFAELENQLGVLHDNLKNASDLDDAASEQWTKLAEQTEQISYIVEDVKKLVVHVNRHRDRKPTNGMIVPCDSLITLLDVFSEELLDQKGKDVLVATVENIQAYAKNNQHKYHAAGLVDYPIVITKNFITYTIFNREYLRKYEKELEKTSVFANSLRPVMQGVRFTLFKDFGDKAIEGRDRWLFYKQGAMFLIRPYIYDQRSVVVDPEDVAITDNVLDSIVSFQKELAAHGVDLMVVIAPGKASIYPDVINAHIKPKEMCANGHSMKIMRALQDRGVETVDLFTPFAEAREHDAESGDSLYLAQDTHWRTRGPRIAAQVIAQRVREKPWFNDSLNQIEYVLDTIVVDRDGDVAVMTNLPKLKQSWIQKEFVTEKVTCHQVYQVRRDATGAVISKNLYRDDFQRSDILVIGDSFSRIYQTDAPRSAGWISHLAYELSAPICSIVSDGGASTLVREKLARKKSVLRGKKLVIWEFVERDLRYGAEGWKNIKL